MFIFYLPSLHEVASDSRPVELAYSKTGTSPPLPHPSCVPLEECLLALCLSVSVKLRGSALLAQLA